MGNNSNFRKFRYGIRRESACRYCDKHSERCHSTCETYKAETEKAKEIKEIIRKSHHQDEDFYRVRKTNLERNIKNKHV